MENGNIDTTDANNEKELSKPSTKTALKNIPIVSVNQDGAEYPMDHPDGRRALIFAHYKYKKSLCVTDRSGTDVDLESLLKMLSKLGFRDPQVFRDLKFSQIAKQLKKVAFDEHINTDCLVVFVLTHGDHGKLYAYDQKYNITSLWETFNDGKNGIKLTGKPKLFFLQVNISTTGDFWEASQSNYKDPGEGVVYQPKPVSRAPVQWTDGLITYKLPTQADFFIGMATVPFFPATQNLDTRSKDHIDISAGSWFIEEICKVFSKYHNILELKPMLTIVSREIAKREANCMENDPRDHEMMQSPMTVSTLLRELYFKT